MKFVGVKNKTMNENMKSASEWQGGDLYAGIDSYEKVVFRNQLRQLSIPKGGNG